MMTSRYKCGLSGPGSALYYQVLTLVTFVKSISSYSSVCSMSQGSVHGLLFCGQLKNEKNSQDMSGGHAFFVLL